MTKLLSVFIALLAAVVLAGCSSGDQERAEPFVGQWESTGGEAIAMRVDPPNAGEYAVRITGGSVDLSLTATQTTEGFYEAKPDTGSVWSFRLVDDELFKRPSVRVSNGSVSKAGSLSTFRAVERTIEMFHNGEGCTCVGTEHLSLAAPWLW